jgi:hypothetical protein
VPKGVPVVVSGGCPTGPCCIVLVVARVGAALVLEVDVVGARVCLRKKKLRDKMW